MHRKIYYKNNVKVNEAKILNPEFYLTYPEEMFVYMHKDACDIMLITALFLLANTLDWLNKL